MKGEEAFRLLGLDPRPYLDPDIVAEAFRVRARELHPDAGGEVSAFQQLNAARRIIEDPAQRLEALAHILRDADAGQSAEKNPEQGTENLSGKPDAEFFTLTFSAAALLQEIKALSTRSRPAGGLPAAMERARCLALTRRLDAVEADLRLIHNRLQESLESLDQEWAGQSLKGRIGLLPKVEEHRRRILSLGKLADNLRAARTELAILLGV